MEFVRKQTPRPDLIILDMNLPFKSGQEVLEELKADADLCEIPVVVFTSSASLRDVRAAYRHQASSYVRKPEDVDEFFKVVAGIERYWTETAVLPAI